MLAALGAVARGAPAAVQPLREAPGNQRNPAIVSNGATFLLAWTDEGRNLHPQIVPAGPPPPPPPPFATPPRAALVSARVSTSGQVRDPGGVTVSQSANRLSDPKLAFGGATSLAVWSDYSAEAPLAAIYGARLSPANKVVGAAPIPISIGRAGGYKANVDVAFDGRNYLVVWQDFASGQGLKVFGSRVTPDGTVLDTTPITIAYEGSQPAIAFDGANYMIAWWAYVAGDRIVYVTRVSPSGNVLDPAGIAVANERYAVPTVAIGFNGTTYLVAWVGKESFIGDAHLRARRVSPSGSVLDPSGIDVSVHPNAFLAPAVASDGNNFLVVWKQERTVCCVISAARVSSGGSLLDPTGIPVAGPSDSREDETPAVAFKGSSYFVAWTDDRGVGSDVYGARVRRDGVNLDPAGILLSTAVQPVRCRVPRVVGFRLSLAQRRIRRAHCSVGAMRRKRPARAGIVLAQKPRAGAIRKRAYPVSLVVGRR
jgi:hypothetical protein